MTIENRNRIAIILAGQEVGSIELAVDVSHAEHQAALKADNARLATEAQGLETRLASLRAAITDAEAHKARIEQDIRQGQVKQSEIEKELVALRRRLTEAAAR